MEQSIVNPTFDIVTAENERKNEGSNMRGKVFSNDIKERVSSTCADAVESFDMPLFLFQQKVRERQINCSLCMTSFSCSKYVLCVLHGPSSTLHTSSMPSTSYLFTVACIHHPLAASASRCVHRPFSHSRRFPPSQSSPRLCSSTIVSARRQLLTSAP